MATVNKYTLNAKQVGTCNVAAPLVDATVNSQLVKDYITALRANARQWSANTKGRSEVSHSTQKPHPQKGGGRSRQGSLAAPHYKGGGRVFAPKPKFDQHVKINQKEKRAAIAALIGDKIREERFIVVESLDMKKPQTKTLAKLLKTATKGKRVLVLTEGSFAAVDVDGKSAKIAVQNDSLKNFKLSLRNIPGAEHRLVQNVNGYDVMVAHDIVITESALKELQDWLFANSEG